MNRINSEIRERDFRFHTHLQVRVGDLNYGGHLANDKFLLYFHEARVRYFQVLGVTEASIGEGVSLTQTEAYVAYKGEAFLGDVLSVGVCIDEFSRARFRVNFVITRPADGQLIATGYTILAGFDYRSRKLQRIPLSFKDKVLAYQGMA